MHQKCAQNPAHQFEISPEEQAFYAKMGVSAPSECPACRAQRRMSWRNDRTLYNRKSDLSGKPIVSMYSSDKPFPVYHHEEWWSDQFDGIKYGRDFDFSRPFFAQFAELLHAVPRFNVFNMDCENSEYVNYAPHNKNCYLIFGSWFIEDCYYGDSLWKNCTSCLDNSYMEGCSLCYENIHGTKCYNTIFAAHCRECVDCSFLYDCRGCKNCAFCSNLRNKENYLFNRPAKPEEIKNIRKDLGSYGVLAQAKQKFFDMVICEAVHKFQFTENCENVSGDQIYSSKNVQDSFMIWMGGQDVSYAIRSAKATDSQDLYGCADDELIYNGMSVDFSRNVICSNICEHLSDSAYCDTCYNSKKLFGCIGLKHNEYCILNKQYTKEQYEALVPKIIAHMKATGEWGEFFPMSISPFAYNESIAQDQFPLTESQVQKLGLQWHEEEGSARQQTHVQIPDNITDVSDEIVNELLTCESCGKNYKLIAQEIKFYREMNLPVPHKCFNCRHLDRVKLQNPWKLFDSKCTKCGVPLQTPYAPDRPEKVYCEQCYLEALN